MLDRPRAGIVVEQGDAQQDIGLAGCSAMSCEPQTEQKWRFLPGEDS